MKPGKLYVIGVGPGDPDLLTLKAVKILNAVPCICVPKGREEGSSLALSIVSPAVDVSGKEIMEAYFPMRKTRAQGHEDELNTKWEETVGAISAQLRSGRDLAFITIGDPTIYSTFSYLSSRLFETLPKLEIEYVPGVSSINASAARAGIPLAVANEKIAILPATYVENLAEVLERFDTVVLMKVSKVFPEVLKILRDMHLVKHAVCIARAGMKEERIHRNVAALDPEEIDYFSILIVRK